MISKIINSNILPLVRKLRSKVVTQIRPKSRYSLLPISDKFGFDRGTPIDRYYIESFMEEHKNKVVGRCLEIHDDAYTKRFGEQKVTKADVADIDTDNKLANIYVDLATADTIPDNTYDTLIITHTIGLIPEHEKAVKHLYRILKPGGTLLLTVSAMGPFITNGNGFWRYTIKSVPYLLEKCFKKENISVKSYGNVLSGQAAWVAMAAEEFTKEELDTVDERYPLVIAAIATK